MKKRLPDPERAAKTAAKIRASKMGKWRALALIAVHVLIGLHITHWLVAGETITPVEPSEAMAFSQSSIINAGFVFFAAMILLTAIFGRFFCGWACHLVALQDWCRHLMLKIGITPRPLKSRALMWVPTLAFLYMFIWPLAYRIAVGDSIAIRGTEFVTSHFWATFPGWIVGALTFLICGFVCVYFLGAKGFCTYACPYGAAFAAADRLAPMRIRVTDACNQCGHCTAVCSSNVVVHEEVRDYKMVVSPGCMKCQDCVSVCPNGALYYGFGAIPLMVKPPEPRQRAPKPIQWRDEALLVTVFVCAFLIVRGLYGVVPFLMSLGVAGAIAFVALTLMRLLREPTLDRIGWRLKRQGTLLPAGRAFVAFAVLLAVFMAHSAVHRWQLQQGDNVYEEMFAARQMLMRAPGAGAPSEIADAARRGIAPFDFVDTWGWFPTLGSAAKQAWLHAIAGEDDAAERYAKRALERNELPADMHQILAHIALRQNNGDAAVLAWQAAIEERPDLESPHLAYGLHLGRQGQLTLASEVFARGLQAIPDSSLLAYNAAVARAMMGDTAGALTLLERTLALDPSHHQARENYAGALASIGRYGEAADQFALLTIDNDTPELWLTRAQAELAAGRTAAARATLETLLSRHPEHTQAREILDSL